jgi:Tfp pilus assembly protein PilF
MLAHFYLGKCYLALGNLEAALQSLLKAVGLEPSSKQPHFVLAQVYGRLRNEEKRKYHLEVFERLNREEKATSLEKAESLKEK